MLDLVIPYIPSNWNEELKYALRSWDTYFKEDFEVTIIGERPDWIINVHHIPDFPIISKDTPIIGDPNQLRKLGWLEKNNKPFIWANDDMYLLQDITFQDIDRSYTLADYNETNRIDTTKLPWLCRLWNTIDRCKELGLHAYNYEAHMPYYYEPTMFLRTFELFKDLDNGKGGWVTQTAYRTLYQSIMKDPFINCKTVKMGIYNQVTPIKVNRKMLFFNHDDAGLSYELVTFLRNKFPNKSKFEVKEN